MMQTRVHVFSFDLYSGGQRQRSLLMNHTLLDGLNLGDRRGSNIQPHQPLNDVIPQTRDCEALNAAGATSTGPVSTSLRGPD